MAKLTEPMQRAANHFIFPICITLVIRLALEPGIALRAPGWLLINLAILALMAGLTRLPLGNGSKRLHWQAAILFVVGINCGYQATGRFLHAAGGWRADTLLHATDIMLLGGRDAQAWLAPFYAPWLTDVMALAYVFFLILLPLTSLYYVVAASDEQRSHYWLGLMTVYGWGLAGYFLLPAAGPYLHHPQLTAPLQHGWVSAPIHAFIAQQTTGVDVWPSLHCAGALYIALWLWRAAPRFGRLVTIPCALVIISTMYMQYHYFIDVVCGCILACVAARFAWKAEHGQ